MVSQLQKTRSTKFCNYYLQKSLISGFITLKNDCIFFLLKTGTHIQPGGGGEGGYENATSALEALDVLRSRAFVTCTFCDSCMPEPEDKNIGLRDKLSFISFLSGEQVGGIASGRRTTAGSSGTQRGGV